MKSKQVTNMAKALATINATAIGADTRGAGTDQLADVLFREAISESISIDDITEAREMYAAKTAKGKQECVNSRMLFDGLIELNMAIYQKESDEERKELFELYSTLLDYWAEHRGEGEYEGPHNCGNCFWLSPVGRRCGCMGSGYFPDCMEDTETCAEWTTKGQREVKPA